MPLQATSGAASYDGFGGGPAAVPTYIEDVFSTWLYTGNSSTQTITNGIDLAGKGGLVWLKSRASASYDHQFVDTARGSTKYINSNNTNAETTNTNRLTAFNADGFTLGASAQVNEAPATGYAGTYASWTFRKQPKFFDVVTYTGDGANNKTISHALGSTPGCIIVKRTDNIGGWVVYHRGTSVPNNTYLTLQTTNAATNLGVDRWSVTGTTFNANNNDLSLNGSGATYVAYLFAHNAGGFGLSGSDNVISCGSFNSQGFVNLGWEPQWIMMKSTTNTSDYTGDWRIFDNMRGIRIDGDDNQLFANSTRAEDTATFGTAVHFNATGFTVESQGNYGTSTIYIAIRRGPMRTPTSGTSVFSAQTGTYSAGDSLSVGFPADMYIDAWRTGTLYKANYSRLVNFANSNSSASQNYLKTNTTEAEVTTSQAPSLYDLWNTTAKVGSWNQGVSEVWWMFRRAPNFFDVVCYTGTGSARTVTHNLGVAPELMIVKRRSGTAASWAVYSSAVGNTKWLGLNGDLAPITDSGAWNNTSPTSTVFTVGVNGEVNVNSSTYVAYLFASCPGVSKVFSYTGNGSSQTINCGFTGGARFVMIKRTDSTGDWYVWDTARGIVANNDPHLSLNSTAAEVTTNDTIDTDSTGFVVNQVSATNVNVNGASYIGLAIA